MTAVTSTLVRTGRYSLSPGVDSDVCGHADEPDIYAHRYRKWLRIRWFITAGRDGHTQAWGWALTWDGALVKALAAAHRDDVAKCGRRKN
jgi:hypothetical protein